MGGLAVSDVWLPARTDGLSCHYGGVVNAGSRACTESAPHAANRATGFVHQRSTEGVDLGGQLSASVAGVNGAARLQKKRPGFDIGARTVLGITRHDEKLRGLSATLPSTIWIFSSPSRTRKDSSVSGCLCQVNSP